MGGGGPSQSTKATVPKELSGLYGDTGKTIQEYQHSFPIADYGRSNPLRTAGTSNLQGKAISNLGANLDAARNPLESTEQAQVARRLFDVNRPTGNLEDGATVQAGRRYYQANIAPEVENRAALSGLGRSTALTNAAASTEASTMLPLLQAEQARRDRLHELEVGTYLPILGGEQARRDALIGAGFQGGQVERGIEQDQNTAQYQDFLRRQGLAEQAVFGPLNQLPSTFGQKTSVSGQSGMFK